MVPQLSGLDKARAEKQRSAVAKELRPVELPTEVSGWEPTQENELKIDTKTLKLLSK